MLTLNTRTRRPIKWSTVRRLIVLMGQHGSSCCRVEDNTTSRILSLSLFLQTVQKNQACFSPSGPQEFLCGGWIGTLALSVGRCAVPATLYNWQSAKSTMWKSTHHTTPHRTAPKHTQHNTTLHHSQLHHNNNTTTTTTQHYTTLHNTTQRYTALHDTSAHNTTRHKTSFLHPSFPLVPSLCPSLPLPGSLSLYPSCSLSTAPASLLRKVVNMCWQHALPQNIYAELIPEKKTVAA